MSARPPPPGWKLEFSKRLGRNYYFNPATKQSLWEYPEVDAPAGPPVSAAQRTDAAPLEAAASVQPASGKPIPGQTPVDGMHVQPYITMVAQLLQHFAFCGCLLGSE
jgi:hypothetical protein